MKKFLFSTLIALLFTQNLVYSVTIVSPADGTAYCSLDKTSVNVSGTVTGNIYGCDSTNSVSITIQNSSGVQIGSGTALVNTYCIWNQSISVSPALVSGGSYTITAKSADGKATSTFTFTDTSENSIVFTYPAQGQAFCGTQEIIFTGTATPSTLIDLWEEGAFNPLQTNISVGTNGKWTSDPINFVDHGANVYTVNAEYSSCGNIAGTVQFTVNRDNPPCPTSYLDPVPPDTSTNDVLLSGYVPAGDTACITITSNTNVVTGPIPIATNSNGTFENVPFGPYVNSKSTASVAPCTTSSKSTRQSSDTTRTIIIDVPANAATLSVGLLSSSSCSYTFSGRGAPFTTVTINQNGKSIGSTEVNASGTYSLTAKLKSGTYSFEAVDEDQYGNQDVSSIVNVTVKNCPVVPPVPPVPPVVPVVRSQISSAITKKYCCINQS